jgi:hypothetical protein
MLQNVMSSSYIIKCSDESSVPMYICIHSACVSAQLIDFYIKSNMYDKAHDALKSLSVTVKELRAKDKFLNKNGKYILTQLEDLIYNEAINKQDHHYQT